MIYVTSDIHGYPREDFLRLLEKAGFGEEDTLYVLGDVIDRNGDGGIAMLRWMMRRPNAELLMGNHEAMMLACAPWFQEITGDEAEDRLNLQQLGVEQLRLLYQWIRNGADPTIRSLRALRKENQDEYRDLMDYVRDAPLYRAVSACGRDFLLVHSGMENFSPDRKLPEYAPDELLWHRPDPEERYFRDVTTVLGHTPTGYLFGEEGRMFVTDTWIDIDTGAAGGGAPMLLRLEDLHAFYADGTG